MADLWLAIAHHVLVFGLVAMLAVQAATMRDTLTGADIRKLGGLDIGYGATAGLIVVIGVLRVIYGAKGSDYYTGNVWFWAKMASFASIGILSIPPTIRFRMWAGALKANPAFSPPTAEISGIRTYIVWELRLIAAVVAFAATMARYRSF